MVQNLYDEKVHHESIFQSVFCLILNHYDAPIIRVYIQTILERNSSDYNVPPQDACKFEECQNTPECTVYIEYLMKEKGVNFF